MNMFERTRASAPDRFIRHYTVYYYFLLINAKKTQKQCRHRKIHDLNPISLHVTRTQCN